MIDVTKLTAWGHPQPSVLAWVDWEKLVAKVGGLIQQTPEWTRQIEIKAIRKLRKSG